MRPSVAVETAVRLAVAVRMIELPGAVLGRPTRWDALADVKGQMILGIRVETLRDGVMSAVLCS